MKIDDIVALINVLILLLNVGFTVYSTTRRLKPEVKKLEAEEDSEIADATHVSLEGAKISSSMLIERIEDLKAQLENEKKSRKADAEYFRRRIRELERESRDYRLWAAKLARQVIEAGKQPAAFESSISESDPLLSAITMEQAEADKASKRSQQ